MGRGLALFLRKFKSFDTLILMSGTNATNVILSEVDSKRKKSLIMDELLKKIPIELPKPGELVEASMVGRKGSKVFFDLGVFGLGMVYGREFLKAREIIKSLKPGDRVTAKIVETENEEGNAELSLKEASQDLIWKEAEDAMRKKESLELAVLEANKGGLVMEYKRIKGFLPASQLKTSHYPRVEGGSKDRILEELKKLEGQTLNVVVIAVESKEEKIIFSEKGAESEELKEIAAKYEAGQIVEGEITGVVDFGIFIKIEEGLEGLCHLSELDWSLVENPAERFKIGDKAKAKIIGIEAGRISLSVKALLPNPWDLVKDKYKKGDIVQGKVLRFNRYGSLVSIEEGVAGLCHISEFGSDKLMKDKLEIGVSYPFQITLFEPKDRRLTLSYLGDGPKKAPVVSEIAEK